MSSPLHVAPHVDLSDPLIRQTIAALAGDTPLTDGMLYQACLLALPALTKATRRWTIAAAILEHFGLQDGTASRRPFRENAAGRARIDRHLARLAESGDLAVNDLALLDRVCCIVRYRGVCHAKRLRAIRRHLRQSGRVRIAALLLATEGDAPSGRPAPRRRHVARARLVEPRTWLAECAPSDIDPLIPPDVAEEHARRRALAIAPRDFTAEFLGDPLPGYSALDRKHKPAPLREAARPWSAALARSATWSLLSPRVAALLRVQKCDRDVIGAYVEAALQAHQRRLIARHINMPEGTAPALATPALPVDGQGTRPAGFAAPVAKSVDGRRRRPCPGTRGRRSQRRPRILFRRSIKALSIRQPWAWLFSRVAGRLTQGDADVFKPPCERLGDLEACSPELDVEQHNVGMRHQLDGESASRRLVCMVRLRHLDELGDGRPNDRMVLRYSGVEI